MNLFSPFLLFSHGQFPLFSFSPFPFSPFPLFSLGAGSSIGHLTALGELRNVPV